MSERFFCFSLIWALLLNQLLPSICVCPKLCQCNKYLQRSSKASSYDYMVSCEQVGLWAFPKDIHPNVTHLYLNGNSIQTITTKMLKKFKMLKILSLSSNEISVLEEGAFSQLKNLEKLDLTSNRLPEIKVNHFGNMSRLREIMLTDNPITSVAVGAFDQFTSLESLYLSETFLVAPPIFTVPSSVVHLHLDNTNIHHLTPDSFKYYSQLEGLYLKRSKIKRLTNQVFRHAKTLKYLLMEHSKLEYIANGAFDGVELHTLSLQGTLIRSLSVSGLTELIQLNLEDVDNLWELSRSYLPNIQHLRVTYEFLCCPFLDHAYEDTGEIGRVQEGTIQECKNQTVGPSKLPLISPTNSRSSRPNTRARTTRRQDDDPFFLEFSNDSSNPLILDPCKAHILPSGSAAVAGTSRKKVVCLPRPDDLNPCEDLLGSDGLRACTWIVTVSATVGNLVKFLVILLNRRKVSQQKLLMCTLAFSNLCMALYLIIIVAVDAISKGHYHQYVVKNWQHGSGCKIAGFLSIFSTELSVLTLAIITLERYYTILYPLHQHKWMTIRQTMTSLFLSAIVAILLATLPLTGVSSYSKVAICLPFDVENTASKVYVTFLLVSNGAAFLIVLFSYSKMYLGIQRSTNTRTSLPNFSIAKKMALIVIVNFSCWAPIAMFSLIAIYGKAIIDVPLSKFLLVFVFPINAFTNPFLYFLLTKQFKHDVISVCARCGLCVSADNVRRDTTTSAQMTTVRSFLTSVRHSRTQRNSGVSLISLFRRASSRNNSDESQPNSTPRNSLPESSLDGNLSFFQRRVSFLLPAGLDLTGRRRSSTSSFSVRTGRRKSYDLAVLADAPMRTACEDIGSSSFKNDNLTEVRNELLANARENVVENPRANCTIRVQESSC